MTLRLFSRIFQRSIEIEWQSIRLHAMNVFDKKPWRHGVFTMNWFRDHQKFQHFTSIFLLNADKIKDKMIQEIFQATKNTRNPTKIKNKHLQDYITPSATCEAKINLKKAQRKLSFVISFSCEIHVIKFFYMWVLMFSNKSIKNIF